MSDTHLERIANLLPEEHREYWLRISSRLPNANKDSQDEIWVLAELIALAGSVAREPTGVGEASAPIPVHGKSREIAEKERQTAATLGRLVESVATLKPKPSRANWLVPMLLIISGIFQIITCWMIWKLGGAEVFSAFLLP